ncbi:MAG: VirB8/TrbF family protein [Gammaproteobacteria bacterium]|jgi:type IV secretion system protein VirB8
MIKNKSSYFDKANSWNIDTYSQAITWRNWSIIIALSALIIAMIAVVAVTLLLPLKENTPFLVFVDNSLGEPLTIKPIVNDELIENEQLKKYMIRKFIIARERYNPSTQTEDADSVYYLANETVYRDYQYYLSRFDAKASTIDVGAINISFLNAQRAYVSFNLLINEQGIMKEIPANAQIKFNFAERFLPIDEAYQINPVNFQVETYQSHYQVNQEVQL